MSKPFSPLGIISVSVVKGRLRPQGILKTVASGMTVLTSRSDTEANPAIPVNSYTTSLYCRSRQIRLRSTSSTPLISRTNHPGQTLPMLGAEGALIRGCSQIRIPSYWEKKYHISEPSGVCQQRNQEGSSRRFLCTRAGNDSGNPISKGGCTALQPTVCKSLNRYLGGTSVPRLPD